MSAYSVRISEDPAPPMPFKMIEGLMPAFPLIALMAFGIVVISFLVGLLVLVPAQADFFADTKAIREGAIAGSTFVEANVTRHVVEAWLPSFKFLGLGLGLLAINMALGLIAKRLRIMGKVVVAHMPADLAPSIPPIPKAIRLMQLSAMMGLMILVVSLVVGIVLATGTVPDYFDHSIAEELNLADPGSTLLDQLATLTSYNAWLAPLRMVGMSFLFTGILIALMVIIQTLRAQSQLLVAYAERAAARS